MDAISIRELYYGAGFSVVVFSGLVIRKISNPTVKKWASTLVGLFGTIGACGWLGSIHILICLLGNAYIMLRENKRNCHVISLTFTFVHFTLFNCPDFLGIPYSPPYTAAVFGMMVFKLIDLAREIQDAHHPPATDTEELKEYRQIYAHITLADIAHYNLCMLGLIQYITYRLYHDWINHPLDSYANRIQTLKDKTLLIMGMGLAVMPVSFFYPPEYIRQDEFYKLKLVNRIVYAGCGGVIIRVFVYICMVAIDMQCVLAGMGAYPVRTKPRAGQGPTTHLNLVKNIAHNPKLAVLEDYDFEAVRNVNIVQTEFSNTLRDGWRNYNNKIQNWYGLNIHKKFPIPAYKVQAAFLTWTLLHGCYGGQMIFGPLVGFSFIVEQQWVLLTRKNELSGATGIFCNIFFWLYRFFGLTYLLCIMAMFLATWSHSYRFLESFYFIPIIVPFVVFVLGFCIDRIIIYEKNYEKKNEKVNESL